VEIQSENLDKIMPALIKARKEIYGAVKNGKGNWGSYASLEDIIFATNDHLLEQDIFISQSSNPIEGTQYIITQATHISGQYLRSITKIENPKPGDPQKALAAQTYTRRAGLESLLNIPRIDDDGEYGRKTKKENMDEKEKTGGEAKPEERVEPDPATGGPDTGELISDQEAIDLRKVFMEARLGTKQQAELLAEFGFQKATDVTRAKLQEIIKSMEVPF